MQSKIQKMIQELEKIENQLLEKINKIEPNNINEKIIELLAEYPDQKHIIKFITFIHDNLSTSQIKSNDIFIDTLTDLINQKKKILELIEDVHKSNKKNSKKNTLKDIPYYAWWSISIFGIGFLIFLFLLIHPEKTEAISGAAISTIKKIK